jgi:hypothetical protein
MDLHDRKWGGERPEAGGGGKGEKERKKKERRKIP